MARLFQNQDQDAGLDEKITVCSTFRRMIRMLFIVWEPLTEQARNKKAVVDQPSRRRDVERPGWSLSIPSSHRSYSL